MMGGEDTTFLSSDSDNADWTKYLDRHHHLKKKKNCSSSSSSSRSTSSTQIDLLCDNSPSTSEEQPVPKVLKNLASKKRVVSEPASNSRTFNSKRNCPRSQLPMGNGFHHERVASNTNASAPNPDSSKTSEMSWQGRHSDWNHHNLSNHSSSSSSTQPSGSRPDTSSHQSRHNRSARKSLILDSDSDDNDWTERTSDTTTFRSHSNSPEQETQQQRSKRTSNNPPRKSKTGYNSRPGRDLTNNNVSTASPSASQTSKETGGNKASSHQNQRVKRNAAGVSGAAALSSSSNEDGNSQDPGQTTPKNRHLNRLRMHQNRSTKSGAAAQTGNSESEAFQNNIAFRRDDPGRRAFSRSGHPLHGRRSRGSPNHHYSHRMSQVQGRESPHSGRASRNSDLELESTDDGCQLFPRGTNSLTRNNFRQASPHHWNNFRYQTFASTSRLESARDNSDENGELDVVFLPENSLSPLSRNRRRDQGRYTGGRRRQSSRPSHLLSGGDHSLLSSSPDAVSQVNQLEEDERLARLLQAEFDAELPFYRDSDLYHSESEVDIMIDEEEILSSLSSSSSNAEETLYGGRHRQHPAQFLFRHQAHQGGNTMNGSAVTDPPTRGRRRGGRPPTSNPSVVPPRHRHWHGSPVRGRRGRTHSGASSDPLMLPFHWLGLALIRGLDAEEDDYEVLWNLAESMGEVVPRGLQRHEINRLPTHKFQASSGTSDGSPEAGTSGNNNINRTFTEATKECRVCLCDYETNELLRVLPCFHEFHAVCIDKWLKNNNTCPVCRAEVTLDA